MQAPARVAARSSEALLSLRQPSDRVWHPSCARSPSAAFPLTVVAHSMNDIPSDTRPASARDETVILPMIGEVAKVGKVEVETGRLEVNKSVEQRVETVETPTTRERYVVERCWINEL